MSRAKRGFIALAVALLAAMVQGIAVAASCPQDTVGGVPCTGDTSNLTLYLVLALVAVAVVVVAVIMLLRRRKQGK